LDSYQLSILRRLSVVQSPVVPPGIFAGRLYDPLGMAAGWTRIRQVTGSTAASAITLVVVALVQGDCRLVEL
jgi:hypothetical protein